MTFLAELVVFVLGVATIYAWMILLFAMTAPAPL